MIIMDLAGTHRLGTRAFLLFLSRHLKWPIIFLVVLLALWTQKDRVPLEYRDWSDYGISFLFLVWVAFAVFFLLRSFFEYRGYSFRFDDEFFNVTRGYFVKHEMGIVYHQIQHVTVRRGILDRAVGVGHLIIVTNVGSGSATLSEIVLPALDKKKARIVQRELLRKAHHHMSQPSISRATASSSSKGEIEGDDEEIEDEDEE